MVPLVAAERSGPSAPFTRIADVPLGPLTDRFDYQSLDPTTDRLFIAGMSDGKLIVVNVRNQKIEAALPGFAKVTGVLAVPAVHKIYASVPGAGIGAALSVALGMAGLSSGAGKLAILDSASLKEIARVPAGVFPDGIAYDPADQKVFVSDELGSAIVVVDALTDKVVARIDTGGEVGNVQYDPITKRVYAPIQSRNELAVIDPKADRLLEKFPLPGAQHPHGLRIADGAAIGYVACDENDRLLVVDLANGTVLQSLPIAHDPDVLAADSGLKRLYIASESGVLSMFDTSDPSSPKKLNDAFIADDAHTVAADPRTHRIYLPLHDVGGKALLRILEPHS
jgi:DNA-binding beta-propeller fold protein YncE